jgi:hypothetical protein
MDRNEALIEPPLPIEFDATYWDHRVESRPLHAFACFRNPNLA